jgi:hypothetical protein
VEQRGPRRRPPILITDRDRVLLAFAARHPLVHTRHVAALLAAREDRARAILRRLAEGGYVRPQPVYDQQPASYRIRQKGLDVIGSSLRPPGRGVRAYEHDVGLAWLWLAAHDGAFGRLREIVSERELRSHDEARERSGPPLAVRLGGVGPGGRERIHYPDLLLRRQDGRTIAVELELSSKGRTRLEQILGGYAADGRIDAVLYLVPNRTIGNPVLAAARRLGIDDLIRVQLVQDDSVQPRGGAARSHERVPRDRRARGRSGGARVAERGL